jgi:hypothetical protein
MSLTTSLRVFVLTGCLVGAEAVMASAEPQTWLTDYAKAMTQAKQEGKMFVILFCASGDASRCDCLAKNVLDDLRVRTKLQGYVRLRVPLDATIRKNGKPLVLIEHPAFDEMLGKQGIAIIDYAHKGAEYYDTVVSCFPVLGDEPYSVEKVLAMLNLPPGTLTQRTLIYAVRIHPDHPASTNGDLDPNLVDEACGHSIYQARIRLQGHHNWEMRFQRIRGRLHGLMASEVCAESWPGENLLQAAIECVRCWRLSSGHWSAVRARQRFYGYDMRRGSNGVWYATGIFGGR